MKGVKRKVSAPKVPGLTFGRARASYYFKVFYENHLVGEFSLLDYESSNVCDFDRWFTIWLKRIVPPKIASDRTRPETVELLTRLLCEFSKNSLEGLSRRF